MKISSAVSKNIRLPVALSLLVALVIVAGSLQGAGVNLAAGGKGQNVQLTSGSAPNYVYQNGELWGGGSSGEKCMACSAQSLLQADTAQSIQPSQPVVPVDGDYTTSDTLFSVPGIYGDLGVTMSYDSQRAALNRATGGYSSLGWDWASPFSATLTFSGGDVTQNEDSGAQTDFAPATSDGCPTGDVQDYRHYTISSGSWNSTTPYCATQRVTEQLGKSTYGTYETIDNGGTDIDSTQIYSNTGQLLYQGDNENPFGLAYTQIPSSMTAGALCPSASATSCDEITDGTRITLAYLDGFGLIHQIFDPAGDAYTIAYDGDANVSSVTDPLGHVTTWGYSTTQTNVIYQHEMTSISTSPSSGVTHTQTIGYTNDMVTTTSDASSPSNGTIYQYIYGTDCGLVVTTTSPDSLPIDCVQGAQQVTDITYPDGEYDSDQYQFGELAANCLGTGTGGCWNFNYPSPPTAQNQWTVVNVGTPASSTAHVEIVYDDSWNVVQYLDPNYKLWNYMYNDNGSHNTDQLCWSADPSVTGFSIGVNDDTYSCSHAPAGAATDAYDANGNLVTQTDPLGNTTRYGYYTDGQLCWTAPPTASGSGAPCSGTSYTIPTGATAYSYDANGDVSVKAVNWADPRWT